MTEGPQSLKYFLPGPFQKQPASRSQLRAAHTSVIHGPQQGLSRSKMCFHFLVSLRSTRANITTDSALPVGTKALQSWFSCSAFLSPKTQENRSVTFKAGAASCPSFCPQKSVPVALLTLRPPPPGSRLLWPYVPPSLWPHPSVTCLTGNPLSGVRGGAQGPWRNLSAVCGSCHYLPSLSQHRGASVDSTKLPRGNPRRAELFPSSSRKETGLTPS